ncbi:MAG: Leucine dehydrogenase [Candidatus Anoxychlamydiales bacterium]|nr:Leucine dehydrogenase [Candidatus Anoxychlamydiales bacterium]
MSITLENKKVKSSKKIIKNKNKDLVFTNLNIDGYEKVYKIENKKTKLLAIIAIHDTTLGPALGGTRILKYDTFDEALTDALRLSESMTYKAAVAEVGFGGGKSVIILNDEKDKTEKLLESFGEAVDALDGRYICAEDMGCTTKDVAIIRKKTKHVVGLVHDKSSGDPGRYTAYGVLRGIEASAKYLFNDVSLKNVKIAIQGLGNVGKNLIDFLFFKGADLIISDMDEKKLKEFSLKYGTEVVSKEDILKVKCDILVPCARGGIINKETIKELNCSAICGAANNQLLDKDDASLLKEKNILYAPDFVVNAGGLLNVSIELLKDGYNPIISRNKIEKIFDEIYKIYEISKENNISTHMAAIKLAKNKIKHAIGSRQEKIYYPHIL